MPVLVEVAVWVETEAEAYEVIKACEAFNDRVQRRVTVDDRVIDDTWNEA